MTSAIQILHDDNLMRFVPLILKKSLSEVGLI